MLSSSGKGASATLMADRKIETDVALPGTNYSLIVREVSRGEGVMGMLDIRILHQGVPVGSYSRNYPSLFDTFYPFKQKGREFALYSPDYTGTRLLSLPDCRDIGGEAPDRAGFCPTGYYIPPEADGQYGFVSGCQWGDDSSWKIEYLDLSGAADGIIVRDDRFGYIELPNNITLAEAIKVIDSENGFVRIITERTFSIVTGRELV